MQSIFNRPPQQERSLLTPTAWNVARAGLMRNLVTVEAQHHKRNMAVKSSHFLVKLLTIARLNYEAVLERFYVMIDVQSNALAKAMGMTCPLDYGKTHDGVFYGPGTTELIIGSSENFDVHEAAGNWQYLKPIRVIYHEKSDLDMHVPNGIAYSAEKGLAIVSVNIPMLFVMYRGFIIEQLAAMRRGEKAKTTSQFVMTYVLPNMVSSHLDFALFNRLLYKAADGKAAAGTSRKHPFALANWTAQTDKVLEETLSNYARSNPTLHDMLCMVPSVTEVNGSQTMLLPAISPTSQYAWIEMVARARVVAGCIVMSPSRLLSNDRDVLMQITRSFDFGAMSYGINRVMAPCASDTLEMIEIIKNTR